MYIILSQKVDSESTYSGDNLYKTYHYPSRYRNQIHTGDVFIYYQGNRYDKNQRYYFGTGVVGTIRCEHGEYYAELIEGKRFQNKVSIYLPEGGYIEQLGFETVRKSVNPPWQTSVRPLSEEAYKYIIEHSGSADTMLEYNVKLKKAVQKYFIENDPNALVEIGTLVKEMSALYGL